MLILFDSLLDIVDELDFGEIVLVLRLELLLEVLQVLEPGLHFAYF